MSFEIIILGTGSALPTKGRFLSAQVVNYDENFFLIDCGEGTQMQLRKYKVSVNRIGAIFISHLHADHYLGLPGLLSSMDLLGRTAPLTLYCPKGLDEFLEVNFRISKSRPRFPLHIEFTSSAELTLLKETPKLEIHSFPLKHRIHCTGFLFREKKTEKKFNKKFLQNYFITPEEIVAIKNGADFAAPDGTFISHAELTLPPIRPRSFAYCSDTAYMEELGTLLQGVDLIYHEATFAADMQERANATGHSTSVDAARVAAKAGAGQLVIGHFSSRYREPEILAAEARTIFPDTQIAVEGRIFPVEVKP
jgi:ribonuclease Z